MSRRDGERVPCGNEEPHRQHRDTSWDGAQTYCPGITGESRVVLVWWHDSREHPPHLRHTRVHLTEGYSDESDIPRILAIRYLRGVEDADRVVIEWTEQEGESA